MTIFSGNAQDDGSTPTLITMVIGNCAQLIEMSVTILKSGEAFHGSYNPKISSAAVFVTQADFKSLKDDLAGGATIPVSITVNTNNAVTQFCFLSRCVPAAA